MDIDTQPRIVIELGESEDRLDSTSDTFNDKIVEAILASDDLTKIFEMKADGTGQFDQVITEATSAIILEIKNLILAEMGFDPATNFTTFRSMDGYTGESVTFLGSTKTMGEWAVLMVDVLDSQQPDPYLGRVNFGLLSSMVMMGSLWGSAFAPGIAGSIADRWNYDTVLITTSSIAAFGVIILMVTSTLQRKSPFNLG